MDGRKLGYYVKKLSKQYEAFKNADLRDFDLTSQQFEIILFLYKHPEKNNQKDIEDEFNITGATASGILKRLEIKNLILRKVSKTDCRFKEIEITNKGYDIINQIKMRMIENDDTLISGFSCEEYETLIGYLKRVMENIKE